MQQPSEHAKTPTRPTEPERHPPEHTPSLPPKYTPKEDQDDNRQAQQIGLHPIRSSLQDTTRHSTGRTRSGRRIVPPLAFWANQYAQPLSPARAATTMTMRYSTTPDHPEAQVGSGSALLRGSSVLAESCHALSVNKLFYFKNHQGSLPAPPPPFQSPQLQVMCNAVVGVPVVIASDKFCSLHLSCHHPTHKSNDGRKVVLLIKDIRTNDQVDLGQSIYGLACTVPRRASRRAAKCTPLHHSPSCSSRRLCSTKGRS